jgi:omega-6 fatty acid desaturase (delta-12 desaturase)
MKHFACGSLRCSPVSIFPPRYRRHRNPTHVPASATLKDQKRAIIDRFAQPENTRGLCQVLTTLLPLAALWVGVTYSAGVSYWLTAAVVALMCLFLVRVFVLMHECGHGSLFRSARMNRWCGFIFGVVSGMPAYVWSQHHRFHHTTNGNWDKYRGPLNIIAVDDYAALTARQQRRYRHARNIWLAPVGGFFYLIFNPRMTWLKGSAGLLWHLLRRSCTQPGLSITTLRAHAREFTTPYWATPQEYWHMFWNNLALLGLWSVMAWVVGPLLFFVCAIVSLSLAGGAGIMLFTVQHNFEHAYASRDEHWDYHTAVIDGTSFLTLPRWLNWFTANIAYHHIHHLSASIPNYCLAACHHEHQQLFSSVTRIRLAQIPQALKYILWDTRARRIVSVADYQQQMRA